MNRWHQAHQRSLSLLRLARLSDALTFMSHPATTGALRAILAVHSPKVRGDRLACACCPATDWPCETVLVIAAFTAANPS